MAIHARFLSGVLVFTITFLTLVSPRALAKQYNLDDFEVTGKVTNVTVGKTTGVTMKITKEGEAGYRAVGKYDSKKLFGRFNVPGKMLEADDTGSCLQFKGDIEFGGNDGSGWPEGTKSAYVMSLYFTKKEVVGTYHISRLEGIDYDQYGTMKLSAHHLIPRAVKNSGTVSTDSKSTDSITENSKPTSSR